MKKLFVLPLSILFLFSCESKKQEKKDEYLVISGKINNFKKRKIKISNNYDFEKEIIFNKKERTFKDTLRKFTPGHYIITVGRRHVRLYLNSIKGLNESIDIIVDAKRRTVDPVFKGRNAAINNYLTERDKESRLLLGSIRKLFLLKEDQFLSKMDKFKSGLFDLAESANLPADYLAKEKKHIHYEFAQGIKNYESSHKIVYGDDNFVVSESFPKEIYEEIGLSNSDSYLFSNWYRDLIKGYLYDIVNKKKKNNNFDLSYLETINSQINDTLIKNHLLFEFADQTISITDDLSKFYNRYKSFSTNSSNKKEIDRLYNKLKLTAKGQPSPKFDNIENYNGGTTSLDDLTGKGKYIYIDIWATWCGFCKKEIPLLKRLEQQFHDKNIEFVSLSVDKLSDKNKWKQTIIDKEMGGIQLFAGKTQGEFQFTQDYLIKGLPRFILIDPDGNIVNSKAPRPSDGDKLTTLLEKLLNSENSI